MNATKEEIQQEEENKTSSWPSLKPWESCILAEAEDEAREAILAIFKRAPQFILDSEDDEEILTIKFVICRQKKKKEKQDGEKITNKGKIEPTA